MRVNINGVWKNDTDNEGSKSAGLKIVDIISLNASPNLNYPLGNRTAYAYNAGSQMMNRYTGAITGHFTSGGFAIICE